MKKSMIMLIFLLLCISAGCQSTNALKTGPESKHTFSELVELNLIEDSVTRYGATFMVYNPTDTVYSYDYQYELECCKDGTWFQVIGGPKDSPAGIINIQPGESKEQTYYGYGKLPRGTYRVVLKVVESGDSPAAAKAKPFYICGEFSVK